jgi:hypothetical protein
MTLLFTSQKTTKQANRKVIFNYKELERSFADYGMVKMISDANVFRDAFTKTVIVAG